MKPGLADMKNAIVVPHIASASKVIKFTDKMVETYRYVPCISLLLLRLLSDISNNVPSSFMQWTREGMATLAALNVLVCTCKVKIIKKKNYITN